MTRGWTRTVVRGVLLSLAIFMVAAIGGAMWLQRRIQTTQYCSSCHIMAPYYDSWKSADFLANQHGQAAITCQACHRYTMKSAVTELVSNLMHTYKIPLKDHRARPEDCLSCHGTYAELAQSTTDLKGSDGHPLGRNPHNSHWGKLDCGICHKMHKASVDYCSKCHGVPVTAPGWSKTPLGNAVYYPD